eukprot:TRINITY_DN17651_c0_g1_i1.p1 TRINITY_DN17651_c0_g1~~TRINITY_DN17651_c0_g1_i1.p1  ORF type:complete len:442 (+),score=131.44 TRINITY_DN17651_c0_g1_i1:438-1763(+)
MSDREETPVELTPAKRDLQGTGGRNRLLFSNANDPNVLFEENSRLRMTVEEKELLVRALEHKIRDMKKKVDTLEDERLTMGGRGVPKVDLHQIREEIATARAESYSMQKERDAANATNIALNAEMRRLREAYFGKDTLLTARGRALERQQREIETLQEELGTLREVLKRNEIGIDEADTTLKTTEGALHEKVGVIEVLKATMSDYEESMRTSKDTIRELELENTMLRGNLKRTTAEAVGRETYEGFDAAMAEAEQVSRERITKLEIELHEARKHETHARAAVQVAHTQRLHGLTYREAAARQAIEITYYESLMKHPSAHPAEKEVHDLLESHLAAFKYLGAEFKKSRAQFKSKLMEEVRALLDKAYEDGYAAASKLKHKRQNQSLLSEASDATTHTSTHSSTDNMQLFETVLRRSPATEIASTLARCGLKVTASPAPPTAH